MQLTIPTWLIIAGPVYVTFLVALLVWYISKQRPDERLTQAMVKAYETGLNATDRSAQSLYASVELHKDTIEQLQTVHQKNAATLERQIALKSQVFSYPSTGIHPTNDKIYFTEPSNGQVIVPPDVSDEPTDALKEDRIKSGDM